MAMDISEQGLLAVITKDHSFDTIAARKVFVGSNDRMRIEVWFQEESKRFLELDRREDPTFDAYGYSLETYEVEVRSDYS